MPPIEVIYENGVFRPVSPVELPEGSLGEVSVTSLATTPAQSSKNAQVASVDNGEDDGEGTPGQHAYRLLMDIAALPHTAPDERTDIGVRHDDILYPKDGRMP